MRDLEDTPSRWRSWDRSAKVQYLTLSFRRADLMDGLRDRIGSDRDSDRFSKSELAHICLESGVVPCR